MRHHRTLVVAAWALVLGTGLWSAVAVAGPTEGSAPAVTVHYETGVDAEGVATADDGGWTVVTDLGFEITVERAVVQTWSTVVIACDSETSSDGVARADLFEVTAASAGHSEAPDPAQATGPVAQVLEPATEVATFGDGVLTADSLCGAHLALAAGEGTGSGRTEPTIEVSGTYVAPSSGQTTPFAVTTDQAWGEVVDLEPVELDGEAITVGVVRDLSSMFDGVDFQLGEADVEASVLRALSAATEVVISPT